VPHLPATTRHRTLLALVPGGDAGRGGPSTGWEHGQEWRLSRRLGPAPEHAAPGAGRPWPAGRRPGFARGGMR
jgi:hypothetical protein